MINIQNESSLHNTLKLFYAEKTRGRTEVNEDGHIYDVVAQNNHIYEIQTKNLSALFNKIQDVLNHKRKITLVYPLVITNTIYLTREDGSLVSKRKSPRKGHILDIFGELTKLYPLLLDKNFTLEILEIDMIEHRLRKEESVQSKNKKRRFKKNWIKVNKRLEKIIGSRTFKSKDDYISLLPPDLPPEFCAKNLASCIKKDKTIPARIASSSHLSMWVLSRMNIITMTKVQSRSHYYKINR